MSARPMQMPLVEEAVISRRHPSTEMIGQSPAMQSVQRLIRRVAPTDKPVLVQGESGTGKELVVRAIQKLGPLSGKPMVMINCAALPEQLVESELFGHQKGSFTGATYEKPGLFEVADGGTLFIDEIGELPLAVQPKLLRVLEDGSLRRVGAHHERQVNVRIIVATNRELSVEVARGMFREDLFYRINVLSIDLPPLRDRSGDIDRLIQYYLPSAWKISGKARKALNCYDWPGNVRQLINVLQRATILADRFRVGLDDLPAEIVECLGFQASDFSHENDGLGDGTRVWPCLGDSSLSLDEVVRTHVQAVLHAEQGNKTNAARKLGIHRRKLYRMLERYQSEEAMSVSS